MYVFTVHNSLVSCGQGSLWLSAYRWCAAPSCGEMQNCRQEPWVWPAEQRWWGWGLAWLSTVFRSGQFFPHHTLSHKLLLGEPVGFLAPYKTLQEWSSDSHRAESLKLLLVYLFLFLLESFKLCMWLVFYWVILPRRVRLVAVSSALASHSDWSKNCAWVSSSCNNYHTGLIWGLNELLHLKCLGHCQPMVIINNSYFGEQRTWFIPQIGINQCWLSIYGPVNALLSYIPSPCTG
jgi:hypothetical protein